MVQSKMATDATALVAPDLRLWHDRVAHVHVDGILNMLEKGIVQGIDCNLKQDIGIFESCVYGKSFRASISRKWGTNTTHILGLVHSDVHGPMKKNSIGG